MPILSHILSRNLKLDSPVKLSSFRKVALGTWRTAGDPSVYGILELDCGPALKYLEKAQAAHPELKLSFTHFVGRAAAETIKRHPELNRILRFGRLYPRTSVDIFFQVATDTQGNDLSGLTIRDADQKSLVAIALEMKAKAERIRNQGDPDFKKMKGTMRFLPGILAHFAIGLSGFLMYTLNLWTPLLGVPRDPFGSMMITSIGSLGLDMAFAPLVPYSRVPCLIAVGAIHDAPVVRNGALAIAPMAKLCATFDHRLIDGVHASKMASTLQEIFAEPERFF